MKRILNTDENPSEVIKKIDDFISNKDNSETIMENIGKMMKLLDTTEQTINGLEDKRFRNEMLGYIQTSRVQMMSLVDAMDSMLEV